ncbi:DUF4397 domain-containing protein [Chitinophaga qingshengii]|uniref:DUF4397 domain-containing protein n=1 Tax=Chitinophaga qingshengii TaxID=1569794 RepID=A0ABR7TS95_9BACT|nr:DUF4397 domain-containing protein [Chitinophaga qingshengii]MBC9932868.1 DUF4397 domain-containing protein [Chitinophaga qingshengii]
MKRIIYSAGCLLILLLAACSKDKTKPGTASLTIINAVPGSRPLVTNFSGTQPIQYNIANQVQYGVVELLHNYFSSYAGSQPLALYQYPDTTEKSKPLFNLMLDLPVGAMRTLFLTGTVDAPDTLFTTDVVPYHPLGDSVCGFRFVNLSPGSAPVKITIKDKNGVPEVASLPFKGITGFRNYPVNAAQEDYTLEFSDAATGQLITSYTTVGVHNPPPNSIEAWAYQNYTFALIGIPGGTNGQEQKVLRIRY